VAKLVAILATTHHPFYYRTSRLPESEAPPFAAEWARKVAAYRETLARVRPDVLVMVGSDHFHQLWLDNMPQFLVGKAPFYDANHHNEEREFGLPRLLLKGHCLADVSLDSLHEPGNATHGFMDFMLMMGLAGYHKADYADSLDPFHTMEAYFTWYPNGVDA
jgi:hypothetical protein